MASYTNKNYLHIYNKLVENISKKLIIFAVRIIVNNTNPVKYFI